MARRIPFAACKITALSLALSLGVAACAPQTNGGASTVQTASSTAAPCFYADQVRNFRSDDRTNIYFDTGRGRIYHAQAAGICQDMDFATALTIRPQSAGKSRLCAGDWANLNVRGMSGVNGPCRVRIVKALSAAEVAALPDRVRP
ncbi:Uncharacterised protein [Brevundimonas diminuta]|jgi:hypothetical protein|uniref:Lipoprotein n=1 Tax=Brevundimonas diminuta TaxID=293 RepID=A0A246K9S4_BREDI|nr:DUF6491 family protein [Brevundimonas diminuta]OJU53218.1 MAG: hypothetical protein BGO02_04935 [Brevundimonas sp. 67-6]EGF96558.1 hypothetical protein BDIM_03630 [Brevundimonas diminuta ATCC 11568]MBD3574414.1 hypothetical protein [Brevundimonas diminuta]OWR18536.1 hypothetical protein CD944_10965 [Brevundimonas diminuta]QAT14057.1 hypothetical protein EQG53_06605 [Brevundimonas diminuta]